MRISEETIAIILRKLGEAGIPISAIKHTGDMDGASFFKCGFLPSPFMSFMMSMMRGSGGEVIEPTGWEGILTVWDSQNALLRAVNGCDHGCQFLGEYNGVEWSINVQPMSIQAN